MFYQAKRSRRLAICRGTPMLLCTLLLVGACSSGSAKAGLGPSEDLAPSIVSLELKYVDRVYGTDEQVKFTADGRYSNGMRVPESVTWESLDGGTLHVTADGSTALFSAKEPGKYRIIGRGRGNGQGQGGGGAQGGVDDPNVLDSTSITISPDSSLAAIESFSINPGSAITTPGGRILFVAEGTRTDGSTVTPTLEWTAVGGTVTSFGEYTAGTVTGGSSVTGTEPTLEASQVANITIIPLPTGCDHQPAGFHKISERRFDSLVEDGWTSPTGTFGIQSSSTGPQSQGRSARLVYPAGFNSGSSPGFTERDIRSSNVSQVYLCFSFQYSPNWDGNDAGVNKMMYLWLGGQPKLVINANGIGAGLLRPEFRLQGMSIGTVSYNLGANLAPAAIERGKWHTVEAVVTSNTPGLANGALELWFDGLHIAKHGGIGWVGASENPRWETVAWRPIYGGAGEPVPAEQWMELDHIYVSGQ